jgi:quinoprotein glucose dehydrogenase
MPRKFLVACLFLGFAGVALLPAADNPAKPYDPHVAPASDEGQRAIQRIRVPAGLKVELFAAEPLLANPVAFCVDHRNRFYVAETFRLGDGVTDIRGHMSWLDDDLACRTVADRLAMLKRRVRDNAASYGVHHDRVRLLEDTKGAGKADRSTVFADGFNGIEAGIGAGLLARGGEVWFTCIPGLWRLRDTKGTGKADERALLHDGFGVHVGYLGHDLHGLRFGPDGKLYFSSGDRGLNVPLKDGRSLFYPDTGCVLRCNPDGSDLEVFATGLRNPQELAFDQYGNLFTGDNNSDAGDKARWVYVVEGGDSGWRIGYQFGTATGPRGPFMSEDLWKPQWEGQAAYIVPPIANVADGPSGLTYYPGLGLPPRYAGHFFLADFRGSSGMSGVRSFAVEPSGASFKLVDQHEFIWSVLATDVDFGTDCAVYLTDWVEGWNKPNKGRIYKVTDPKLANDAAVKEVKKLLAEGMKGRGSAELVRLLAHKDMRVRQEAQFALAEKGAEAVATLTQVAREGKELLPRLHAVWGLGQVGRKDRAAYEPLLALLGDGAPEVRAQAAKVLGDGKVAEARGKLVALLADAEPRVRFFAAQALAHVGGKEAVAPVLAMLRDNADRDTYLRHAGVMALAAVKDQAALLAAADDASPAVRRAVLLALRRRHSPEVARFLGDADASLVLEAARAIYDLPVEAALPKLAALIQGPKVSDPLGYRVLNANFRLGQAENAAAVARFAARSDASEALRVEALKELADWAKPAGRDRVMGLWRPLPPRSADVAAALRPALGGVFSGPDRVRQEAARLAGRLGIKEVGPLLLAMAGDGKRPAQGRVEALRGLAALGDDARLGKAMELALSDADPRVRTEGRRLLAQARPAEALASLAKALGAGPTAERQGAFAVLGEMKGPGAAELLGRWLDTLLRGEVEPALRLDLVEAAARRPEQSIKDKVARYEAAAARGGPVARYRDALVGGDAEAGRRIFFEKAEVSCLRCHKVGGVGGEVGPDLSDVGKRQNRDYLLESIVEPSKQIAKGFETLVLTLTSGKTVVGVLKSEDAREVKLMTAEGKLVVVPKDQIEERQAGKSAMPEDVTKYLSRSEVRDLVEYLAGLKGAPAKH